MQMQLLTITMHKGLGVFVEILDSKAFPLLCLLFFVEKLSASQ